MLRYYVRFTDVTLFLFMIYTVFHLVFVFRDNTVSLALDAQLSMSCADATFRLISLLIIRALILLQNWL
jgi:hypothetical protein